MVLLVLLAVADPGRARASEPTSTLGASNEIVMQLRGDTTAETVIPQIVEAGREQLASACAPTPTASVRIFNPLAEGSHEDVACSTILDGGSRSGRRVRLSRAAESGSGRSSRHSAPSPRCRAWLVPPLRGSARGTASAPTRAPRRSRTGELQ